ncbi:MAG: DUF2764 family protein [Candidatus Omnitrophota bacterium]|nr:DUF2764 family protein [Candidatus Omnitrophota bacterium]
MGRDYYYFVASLPSIFFEKKPSLSLEDFLKDAERLLEDNDYRLVREMIQGNEGNIPPSNAVSKKWFFFNRDLRNELAYIRAKNANKDPQQYIRGEWPGPGRFTDLAQNVLKAPDPLTGEKILDHARWQDLEDLGMGHFFDLEAVVIYGLKLKILERYQLISSSRGEEVFQEYQKVKLPEHTFVSS